MKWGDFRRSDNVEDRTGEDAGGGGFPGGGGIKLGGGALVVIVIASLVFGVNPLEMIGMIEGGGPRHAARVPATGRPRLRSPAGAGRARAHRPPRRARRKDFAAAVLGDTEDVWGAVFQTMGARYEPPKLVLFSDQTAAACGHAVAATRAVLLPGRPRSSIWTRRSSASLRAGSARPAISRRPT